MRVRNNACVDALPSYHSAWSLAASRLWEADQERMAWLNERLERDEEPNRKHAALLLAKRAYMRRRRKGL